MRIKIARIITRMDLGGAQQSVLYLSQHLDPQRFDQVLITGAGGLLFEELASLTATRHQVVPALSRQIGPRHLAADLQAVTQIRKILVHERPQILHTHTPKAGILGRWAGWWAGVPRIIHTYHGFGFGDSHPPLKKLAFIGAERLTRSRTSRFVAVSEEGRLQGSNYGFYSPEQCCLIRSGIDLTCFPRTRPDPAKKKLELGLSPTDTIVGTVAGFKPPKGLHDFLRVAHQVSRRVTGVKFVMVGDGELRPQLEDQVRRLDLTSSVIMTGWRRDVADVLAAFDVFLLTSLWEGLPKVLIEAKLAGLPVVATNVGGAAEIIDDGQHGILVPPGDIEGMSEALVRLLEDQELRHLLSRSSRDRIEQFSAQKMVLDYQRLYLEVMGLAS